MDYVIRPLTELDEPLLWEMLYQGLRKGDEEPSPPADIVKTPEMSRYVANWGQPGDSGFAAYDTQKGHPIGAAWLRECNATDAPPELALAVRPGHRRRGIGAALLTQWVKANPEQSAVSLAVSAKNPAVRLYERFGFKVVSEKPGSVTMQREV